MMKQTAVFMSIGRGPTVKEDDLIKALKKKVIGGAVLDVFAKEPLDSKSDLWKLPNVFITPHCADQDPEWQVRSMQIMSDNIKLFKQGKPLINVCEKKRGY